VPTHAEDYIHRIGRTGRAGRSGISITLVTPSDGKYLDAITRLIQKDIPLMKLEGGVAEAPVAGDEAPAREGRPRRGRTRGGERREGGQRGDGGAKVERAPRPPRAEAEEQPTQAAQPAREPQSPRPERAPREDRPARAPRRDRESASSSGSPFGSDGPVPAFLLRPSGAR
jgi:superfamily II DNA/RNA helicase